MIKNVSYVGYSEEKKIFYLSMADLVVFPTTTRDYDGESWGVTTLEAMSAAKPILATNAVGCAEEVVKHEKNGFIIQHGEVEPLINAIKKLLSDEENLNRMGEVSRELWDKITWQNYFLGYKKAIEYSLNPYNP